MCFLQHICVVRPNGSSLVNYCNFHPVFKNQVSKRYLSHESINAINQYWPHASNSTFWPVSFLPIVFAEMKTHFLCLCIHVFSFLIRSTQHLKIVVIQASHSLRLSDNVMCHRGRSFCRVRHCWKNVRQICTCNIGEWWFEDAVLSLSREIPDWMISPIF